MSSSYDEWFTLDLVHRMNPRVTRFFLWISHMNVSVVLFFAMFCWCDGVLYSHRNASLNFTATREEPYPRIHWVSLFANVVYYNARMHSVGVRCWFPSHADLRARYFTIHFMSWLLLVLYRCDFMSRNASIQTFPRVIILPKARIILKISED